MLHPGPVILLIEDDPQMRRFLRIALEGQKYSVVESTNGEDGIRQTSTGRINLIILDLGLPDVDGLALTRRVRELSTIPIIIVSARENEQDKIAALDSGADDYVTKPFSVNELLARVRVAFRAHRTVPNREVSDSKGDAELEVAEARVSAPLAKLSAREIEVLRHVAEGKSSKQIAYDLFITTKTVVFHRQSIMRKLGLRTVAELTKYAVRSGLTSL